MRKLRQFSMTVVLALMLANAAFAGTIGTSPAPAPEPSSATAPGTIDTPPSAQSVAAPTDPVVAIALNLLQSVLSIF